MCQDFQLWEEEEEKEEEEKREKIVNNPSTLCSSILTVEEETWTKGLWFLATLIIPEKGLFQLINLLSVVIVPGTTDNSITDRGFVTALSSSLWVLGFSQPFISGCSLGHTLDFVFRCSYACPNSPHSLHLVYVAFTLLSLHSYLLMHSLVQHQTNRLLLTADSSWVPQLRLVLCSDSTLCWITSCSTNSPSSNYLSPYYCGSASIKSIWGNYTSFNFLFISVVGLFSQFLHREVQIYPSPHIKIIRCHSLHLCVSSNRQCLHPSNIPGTKSVKIICIYFNESWSFFCCLLFYNTWNKWPIQLVN